MARAARPWFRVYVEAVSDRKLRRIEPAQRWLWIGVLAAACGSPVRGALMVSDTEVMDEGDLADLAGVPTKLVGQTLPVFEKAGMIHRDAGSGAWVVTNWTDRQFESDAVSDRTRRHRSNHPARNDEGTFQRRSKEPPSTDVGTPTRRSRERVVGGARNDVWAFEGTMTESESEVNQNPSSSTPKPPRRPERSEEDDEPTLDGQAMRLLAQRALQRRIAAQGPVNDESAWMRAAIERRKAGHAATIAALDLTQFATPEQVADRLEPPPQARPPDPSNATQAAEKRVMTENDLRRDHPCPACAGSRHVDHPNGTGMIPCTACSGSGIALPHQPPHARIP